MIVSNGGTGRRLLILFGSQTGTAQAVAERISRETRRFHFSVILSPMDDYPIKNMIKETLALFVCSTTGQGKKCKNRKITYTKLTCLKNLQTGDVPDNMRKFWKFLLRRDLPTNSLESLQFGVLGLGDSGYQVWTFLNSSI